MVYNKKYDDSVAAVWQSRAAGQAALWRGESLVAVYWGGRIDCQGGGEINERYNFVRNASSQPDSRLGQCPR